MKKISQIQKVLIPEEFKAFRLDVFLTKTKLFPTRSQALKHIAEKRILLNGSALKASYRLRAGDLITVALLDPKKKEALSPYHFPLDIPFEDDQILIVNKPAGLTVHPGAGHKDKTLVNILFHQKKLSLGSHPLRPGIVHRLDKDVSGLLILAKTNFSQDFMIRQFKNHLVQREYWALSLRPPSPLSGQIESWISRHPIHRKKFISLPTSKKGGKKAISSYRLFKQSASGISWIKCRLKTGRTHQLRLHLSSISCPLAGDKIYGGQKLSFIKDESLKKELKILNRIALHAHRLSFPHPLSKKKMIFTSGWPSDLKTLLKKLNFN